MDFFAGLTLKGDAFLLATGGYVAPKAPMMYGDKLTRKAVGAPPLAEAKAAASRELAAPVSAR